jgi:hypothetical protein
MHAHTLHAQHWQPNHLESVQCTHDPIAYGYSHDAIAYDHANCSTIDAFA